jgi:hypothetical protein
MITASGGFRTPEELRASRKAVSDVSADIEPVFSFAEGVR